MLERLTLAAQVGKTRIGGIDLNKALIRHVVEALIALSPRPTGLPPPMSPLAAPTQQTNASPVYPRHAAYDLKNFAANRSFSGSATPAAVSHSDDLRAMTALLILRDKAVKPLLAAAQPLHPSRGAHNPKPIEIHYQTLQTRNARRLP